jgi:hypothetical protein
MLAKSGWAEIDDTLVRVAKMISEGHADAFSDVRADQFYDAIKRGGEAIRQDGESAESARVRFMKSEGGKLLLAASRRSAGSDHRPTPAAPATPTRGPAGQKIADLASSLVLSESKGGAITPTEREARHAAARTRVRRMHPDIAAAESAEEKRRTA